MQLIVDFVLLAASAAAAIYCFILSVRLKKLNDVRGGLGATIASLSAAIDHARKMLEEARRIGRDDEERLRKAASDAAKLAPEIAELLDALAEAAELAALDIEQARNEALIEIRRSVDALNRKSPANRPDEWAA